MTSSSDVIRLMAGMSDVPEGGRTERNVPHGQTCVTLRCSQTWNPMSVPDQPSETEAGIANELAQLRAMLQSSLEANIDGVLLANAAGQIVASNSRFERLWNISQSESIGDMRQTLQVCSKRCCDAERFLEEVVSALREAASIKAVVELNDGRWIECQTHVPAEQTANVTQVWTFRDITEQRKSEISARRLSSIVETSDDAIISKTLDGIITTWNRGAEIIFGYTAEEAIGQSILMLIPEERHDEEPRILERLRRNERIDHFETVRVRKDGTRINISITVSPLRDSLGRVVGASKIARDITAAKRAQAILEEESRILGILNGTGSKLASRMDVQELLQIVTDSATELAGAQFGAFFYNATTDDGDAYTLYTLSGAPREAFEDFGHPRATPLFAPTFRGEPPIRVADVLKDPRYGQMPPHHGMPKGHLTVRSYLAVPVVSRSGAVIGGLFFGHSQVGVFTERVERIITGIAAQASVALDNARLYDDVRKASEERRQLLDAERAARSEAERTSIMKDEFLATLSHELRTPLNAILGWSEVLLGSESQDPASYVDGLEAIGRNARAQARLIEDLLDMNRIISGKVRLDVQQVELGSIVDSAVDSVKHSADAKSIRFRKVVDSSAGPVSGDPTRLQQVIWNLLTNAIKFTPKGGKVDLLVQRVNSHVEIIVHDSGEGIAPEFLPHVFERFRQADSSLTRRHGGLGLGLSIVKQLVEMHGGTVQVESAGTGKGSTFSVFLPLAPVRSSPRREHPLSSSRNLPCPEVPLDGLKVLVVDDERDARELLRRVLTDCHATVLTAEGGDEALRLIETERPEILISDIGMPDMDGYQFLRKVRKLAADAGGKTPAIALTAFARSEDRTRAMNAGYQVHISKPIEPQELLATVANLSGRTVDSDED